MVAVEQAIEAALGELARASAEELIGSCGLGAKLAALQACPPSSSSLGMPCCHPLLTLPWRRAAQTAEAQPHIPMASVLGLEPLALATAMRSFYATLFQRGDRLVPAADLLDAPPLRRRAAAAAAKTLASTHAHIHSLVKRAGAGYESPETILLHSPAEVETLLDVA